MVKKKVLLCMKIGIEMTLCSRCGVKIPKSDLDIHMQSHNESMCIEVVKKLQKSELPKSPEELMKVKYPINGDPKNILCEICLVDFEVGETAVCLSCLHKFHPPCILGWLKKSTNCPKCQTVVIEHK